MEKGFFDLLDLPNDGDIHVRPCFSLQHIYCWNYQLFECCIALLKKVSLAAHKYSSRVIFWNPTLPGNSCRVGGVHPKRLLVNWHHHPAVEDSQNRISASQNLTKRCIDLPDCGSPPQKENPDPTPSEEHPPPNSHLR